MEKTPLTFSALLKNIRKQAGLTQQEFATSLGVSKVLIGMLESDMKEPSKKFVVILANKLEVHPSAVMPFVSFDSKEDFGGLSTIEKSLMKMGLQLQHLLVNKKSHLLRND